MIKHIVFDFGGVILDLDGVHTGYPDDLAIIFNIPAKETKKIWDKHKTSVMIGEETPRDFLSRMKSELSLDFDVDEGIAFWEKRNALSRNRIDWELVSMLEQLKKRYQVHMLTDQIPLDNGAASWIHDINQHFHTIFRSYEQGYRKPFTEAYQNLLEKINATNDPASVVFIDDNKANIDAANEIGVHGILYIFKDRNVLEKKFEELGIEL